MIGKAYRLGTGFKGLAAYLERGHLNELDPERVAWIDSRNLPTRDPEAAARLMAATARDSERCVKPVYHLSISFDPGDPVNPETMRRVADRTLRDLGLDDHQALLVAHRDRQHPHVHIVVNRVHPERRTAWSNSWDYRRIEQSLRAQEADLGLRVVPGKHAPVPERALERVREAPQRVPGDLPFVERVRAQAGPHLTGARSWAELERGLAEHGLSLRLKGRGMVLTDGRQEVKASKIDREASRFRLERRLGLYTDYRARQAVAARTLEERAPLRGLEERVRQLRERVRGPGAERTAIPAGIKPERPRTPQVQRPPAPDVERTRPRTYREAAREFSREARHLYADPAAARRAFLAAAERSGADRAAARLGDEPRRFGALRPGADPSRARRAADAAFDYARHHATRDRPALTQAAALLREVDGHQRAAHGADALSRKAARAAQEPVRLAVLRREAAHAARLLREAAPHVYREPARALRAVERYRARFGVEETARAIREAPDHFGRLRSVESSRYLGLVRVTSYEAAHTRAADLSDAFRRSAVARVQRPRPGDVERAARHARETARALEHARAGLRSLNVQAHVREAASRLMAAGLGRTPEKAAQLAARLAPMLPTSALHLVRQTMQIGRTLARGLDNERERDRGLSR